MTTKEVERVYNVPANTVVNAIRQGRLTQATATKFGTNWNINDKSTEFKNWLAARPKPGRGRKKKSK